MTDDPATTAVATATAVTIANTNTSNNGERANANMARGVVAVATSSIEGSGGGSGALSAPLLESVESVESVEDHLEGGVLAGAGAGVGGLWPSAGAVEFRDVTMCYRPGLPPVLKGLSFSVEVRCPESSRHGSRTSWLALCSSAQSILRSLSLPPCPRPAFVLSPRSSPHPAPNSPSPRPQLQPHSSSTRMCAS